MIDVEKLSALIDNELDPAERAEVEKFLANDPQATAQVSAMRSMKTALQDCATPVKCDDEWKACVKRLNEIDKAKTTRSIVDRWAWAMCSCLFVFIAIAGFYNRSNPGIHAGVGDLSRAGMEKPVRDIYHWLKSELGGAPSLPASATQGSEGSYGEHRVLKVVLQDHEGQMGLLIVRGNVVIESVKPMDDGNHFLGQNGDKNSIVWSESGNVLILTGTRSPDELRDVADRIHL
jgi:hypothetical protein